MAFPSGRIKARPHCHIPAGAPGTEDHAVMVRKRSPMVSRQFRFSAPGRVEDAILPRDKSVRAMNPWVLPPGAHPDRGRDPVFLSACSAAGAGVKHEAQEVEEDLRC